MSEYNIAFAFETPATRLEKTLAYIRLGDSMGGWRVKDIALINGTDNFIITCFRKHNYPFVVNELLELIKGTD